MVLPIDDSSFPTPEKAFSTVSIAESAISPSFFMASLLKEYVALAASVAAAATPIAVAAVGPNSFELMSKAVGVLRAVETPAVGLPLDAKKVLTLVMIHSSGMTDGVNSRIQSDMLIRK